MASQMYSRYIPPTKKKVVEVSQTLLKHTPPPTQNDASSMYARYVPYSQTKTKAVTQSIEPITKSQSPPPTAKRKHADFVEVDTKPTKKSKKQRKEQTDQQPVALAETLSDGPIQPSNSVVPDPEPRKPKKNSVEVRVQGEDEEDARHYKLMAKREKSLKKAEKLAKKATTKVTKEEDLVAEKPQELHDLIPLPQPEPVPELPIQSTSDSLPPWLSNPIRISPTATASFTDVGVTGEVAEGLQKKGFKEAFAVQAAVLPLLLPGSAQQEGDVLVSAATGSGKTLAYVLPMFEDISRNKVTKLRGLIVLPTRELVSQVREVSEICSSVFSGRRRLRFGTAVGNDTFKAEQSSLMGRELMYDPDGYRKQQTRLNAKWENSDYDSDGDLCDDEVVSNLPDHVINPVSKVDILICTPGRLVEHVKSSPGFTLENIKWLVVDEADKLLGQNFQQWLDVVMVGFKDPRKVILSATMTRDIGQLNGLKLHRPKLVVLEGGEEGTDTLFLPSLLLESGIKVDDEGVKPLYLMEVLRREGLLQDSSEDEDSPHGVMIFTKSNETAVRLSRLIALLEPSCSDKIGTLTSTTRSSAGKSALKSFECGKLSILVASDLVSRGLDLPNLAHVINYDIPTSLTNYVHRVGRTARAGKKGHAWTLFTSTEGRWFWKEIGRAEGVRRNCKVERVNINGDVFEQDRERYEEVLEELGREAGERKGGVKY